MYTLVSAAVLAADLVRHPAGAEVADVLDAALRFGRPELERLGRAFCEDAQRRQAWLEVEAHAGLRTSVSAALGEVRRSLRADEPALAQAEAQLYRASFGGLEDLLACLREEVFAWTRHAVDDLVVQTDPLGVRAVADALGAAYVRTALAPASRERLRGPWLEVFGEVPVVAVGDGFGPHSADVRALCDRVATAGLPEFERLHDAQRTAFGAGQDDRRDWAPVMHQACQAAFVAGRVREVAAAQLAGARAALVAGVPVPLAATGVMTALTGAVQAVALADLLDDDTFGALVAPWEQAFGEL